MDFRNLNGSLPQTDPEPRKSHGKFFILGGLVVLIAFGIAAWAIWGRSNDGSIITFQFNKPDEVLLGEPFALGLVFTNPSDKVLKDAHLVVTLPDGLSFEGEPQDQRVMEQVVGDLGPGSLSPKTFNLIATDGSQSLKRITVKLEYSVPDSKVKYQDQSEVDVSLGQAAITLKLTAPEKVVSGEDFDIKLAYNNNSNQSFRNLKLRVDYPPIFKFKSASLDPDKGNNQWELGGLEKGANAELTIKGSALGPEKSFFNLTAVISAEFSDEIYAISTQVASVSIAPSSLSLNISVNNSDTAPIARVKDVLAYTLQYKNNSDTTLENVTLKATLIGEMFDFKNIASDAFFNSVNNTFTWTVTNTSALASVPPGAEGQVVFSIKIKDNFPIRRLSDKNYLLKVQAQAESLTVPQGTASNKTTAVTNTETKLAGNLSVDARGYFRDAASGIANNGPYPPKVNQPTQYTIHWRLSSEAVDASNVKVTAFLQSGARWTGKVKSNITELPTYDATSGKVTWNITKVTANKGVISGSTPLEAIFQVELTPAVNQVGLEPNILDMTKVEGHDDFADSAMSASDSPLTTNLPDDTTLTNSIHGVQP